MIRPSPLALKILSLTSIALFLAALGMIFFYAPLEATMTYVQKIFYLHLANAWIGMLGFLTAALAGSLYLIKKDELWDIIGVSAVEISLVFFFVAIVTGSIWARPTWGTWWTWEPRLTTAAIVELIYIAYFLLRQSLEDPERRARLSAVYALVGAISVPVTFLSIRVFRTIHPSIIGSGSSAGLDMAPRMLHTMGFTLFAFSVIFSALLWHRVRLGQLAQRVERLRMEKDEEND